MSCKCIDNKDKELPIMLCNVDNLGNPIGEFYEFEKEVINGKVVEGVNIIFTNKSSVKFLSEKESSLIGNSTDYLFI